MDNSLYWSDENEGRVSMLANDLDRNVWLEGRLDRRHWLKGEADDWGFYHF